MTLRRNKADWAQGDCTVRFDIQGASFSIQPGQKSTYVRLERVITNVACGTRMRLILHPFVPIKIEEVRCDLKLEVDTNNPLFFNGYQSWTDSREWCVNDTMPHLSALAKPMVKKYKFDRYGDTVVRPFSHRKGHFHGFSFATIGTDLQKTLFGSLNEKDGFTILEYFHDKAKWVFSKDNAGCVLMDERCVLDLVCLDGTSDEVYDAYFQLMGIKPPRMNHATGWTSWYNYYQNISETIIEKNLANFNDGNCIGFFQIDDGYQTAIGDWLSVDLAKFSQGMKPIADKIHAKGMKAGIWLAPFVAETKSQIFRDHPEWFIKDDKGEFVCGGSNWSGFYALDLDRPEVRDHLRAVFDVVLNDWGYDMVKLDFLYAACMLPRNNKSRGQLMAEAMLFVRDCVKEKYILGCGVPLASSFGLVDFCRIGCDVGLDWDDKFYMRLFHRERISTHHAIGSSIGRRHLDGRAFANDPDVFLLRDTNLALTPNQKRTLALSNWLFGSLLFTSDDLSLYNPLQRNQYRTVMNQPKPVVTSTTIKHGVIRVETVHDGIYHMNLTNRPKSIGSKRVLAPFESIKEEME